MKFFKLTEETIKELKKPWGKLFKSLKEIEKEKITDKFIISVGDITTKNLLNEKINFNVAIYDNKTLRNFIDEKIQNFSNLSDHKFFETINPPGIITEESMNIVRDAINNKFSQIFVRGEEDLFVIPAIKFSDENAIIFYGQPGEGIVMIENSKILKEKIDELLKKFKLGVMEIVKGKGHRNVLAKHRTTFEITKENYLTKRGDCIIAININKGIPEFDEEFKNLLKEGKNLKIEIECEDLKDTVIAEGSNELILNHPEDIVIRKSKFIDSRTLAINADKAARDLNRNLIRKISEEKDVIIKFIIE
ncbi:MAG: DUF371 domain-containing protein [Candidatus Altarchaeaceae archaeon]